MSNTTLHDHHLFVDGEVKSFEFWLHEATEWLEQQPKSKDFYGYSPNAGDEEMWFITSNGFLGDKYIGVSFERVPKEFIAGLVLLGVPINK